MTNTTTFPGLVSLDPIAGLQAYVQDVKPYHTKVFETLVEYVYTDYVNVSIVDRNVIDISMSQADEVDTTVNEDGDLVVPTSITEMFDFFITAPTPVTSSIDSSDLVNFIIYLPGNLASSISVGDLLVVDNLPANKFQVLAVAYSSSLNQTTVTLNDLTVSGSAVTIYSTDTVYNFAFPIQSAVVGPIPVTEPVTGTSFNVSTFTVPGNATRALQAGSIFKATPSLPPTSPVLLYHAVFVQFIPSFNVDGSRNPPGDVTIIGVELDTIFNDAVINSGYLIPYNITGFDGRYDAPYDGMAGYHIVSG